MENLPFGVEEVRAEYDKALFKLDDAMHSLRSAEAHLAKHKAFYLEHGYPMCKCCPNDEVEEWKAKRLKYAVRKFALSHFLEELRNKTSSKAE